jgi:tyrosine aminotransferase
VINNPSNPCGSNFTKQHVEDILRVAERNFLPIISDEMYADMIWTSYPFTPISSIPSTVPIITIGGLAKRWLVPGWRLGWCILYDRNGAFTSVRRGMANLSQVQLHPNTVLQSALPEILKTPKEFFEGVNLELRTNAELIVNELNIAKGLKVVRPQGALYAMVRNLPN